jgi:hypothetical protein
LTAELAVIAKNERRFIGFSSDDSGFDPERHRGRAVVTTMHKAKGLEWDRVYLMSVNNYDFPSNMPNDRFISEKLVCAGFDTPFGLLNQRAVGPGGGVAGAVERGVVSIRLAYSTTERNTTGTRKARRRCARGWIT